jgi:uncharacterized coiled-coil protein SlyX
MRHRHRSPKLRLDGLATADLFYSGTKETTTMTNATTNCIIVAKGEAAMPIATITKAEAIAAFFKFRRLIRGLIATEQSNRQKIRKAARNGRKLKDAGNPFDHARIANLDATVSARRHLMDEINGQILEVTKITMELMRAIDKMTTLEERFDILNTNRADRGKVETSDDTGLVALVALYGLDDSAMHRRSDSKEGAMAIAINEVMIDCLRNTEEGQALGDSLFEPGGLLAGIPMYQQQPDGSLKRMPPRLRVVHLEGSK